MVLAYIPMVGMFIFVYIIYNISVYIIMERGMLRMCKHCCKSFKTYHKWTDWDKRDLHFRCWKKIDKEFWMMENFKNMGLINKRYKNEIIKCALSRIEVYNFCVT